MTESAACPKCHAILPVNAPGGICPKCLLNAGFPSEPAATGFTPPPPVELDSEFPDLDITELIGKGGMGAVYKAHQKRLDRTVAVKILPPEVGDDPAFAARFEREARMLARLNHPNIVQVYDFGKKGQYFYFLMEFVGGSTLRHIVEEGGVNPQEALTIVPHVCEALQFAHDQGIVHRDIKPENILIDMEGRVRIADFGLAMLLDRKPSDMTLTGANQVMGTPHYMAPEQMRGSHAIDQRADIYSLGVVFYELLTGELPIGRFEAPSQKLEVDVRLDEVVLRALAADPDRRYQKASDVQHDVEQLSTAAVTAPTLLTTAPNPPGQTYATSRQTPPRFSRQAILGAVWAPFFFIIVLMTLFLSTARLEGPTATTRTEGRAGNDNGNVTSSETEKVPVPSGDSLDDRTIWQWFMLVIVLPIGLAAPFGTTILGLVAISNIRHSNGRLTGLPLAVADAILFPLLLLDILVGIAVFYLLSTIYGSVSTGLALLLSLIAGVILDIVIARACWKRASRGIEITPTFHGAS